MKFQIAKKLERISYWSGNFPDATTRVVWLLFCEGAALMGEAEWIHISTFHSEQEAIEYAKQFTSVLEKKTFEVTGGYATPLLLVW